MQLFTNIFDVLFKIKEEQFVNALKTIRCFENKTENFPYDLIMLCYKGLLKLIIFFLFSCFITVLIIFIHYFYITQEGYGKNKHKQEQFFQSFVKERFIYSLCFCFKSQIIKIVQNKNDRQIKRYYEDEYRLFKGDEIQMEIDVR